MTRSGDTQVKALMEVTGQSKDDVAQCLEMFGGDEALAVAELLKSTFSEFVRLWRHA